MSEQEYSEEEINKIVELIKAGDTEEIKQIMSQGNIRLKNEVLTCAAGLGNLNLVKYALEQGAEIQLANNTPLGMAVKYGHLETVEFLIENGADIHTEDDMAFRIAAGYGYLNIAKLLLEKGADIQSFKGGALIGAALNGHLEMVKLLIKNGIRVSDVPFALTAATTNGHTDIMRFLLENGTDVHFEGDRAFSAAAEAGNKDAVILLIEHGANLCSAMAKYVYKAAVIGGVTDLMAAMLNNGFDRKYARDLKYTNREAKEFAMNYLSKIKLHKNLKTTLPKKPADTNIRDKKM